MSRLLVIAVSLIIIFSGIFASWYVSHGDIIFSADIGRDFTLLRQVDEKKIVLIGPRASGELYHGPLWLYVNYPAFAIGHGNPIAVGWNWVLLWAVFVLLCFFVARELFGYKTAAVFAAWIGLYAAFHVRGMNNPHGAMILMPLFIYFFVTYLKSFKLRFLICYFLTLGAITQFEIAVGIPLIILSIPPLMYTTIKQHKAFHLFSFLVLALTLANFALFDLRHRFLIFHKVMTFVSPRAGGHMFNYALFAPQRFAAPFTLVEFLRENIGFANLFLFLLMLLGIYVQLKAKRFVLFYLSALYFYFGFFVLSFVDKGPLLYWYIYPFYPMLFLVASSFMVTRFKIVFLCIFCLITFLNIKTAVSDMQVADGYIGKSLYSWKFLDAMSQKVFLGSEAQFGYFVYSPDAFAYEEKYAMYYESTLHAKRADYFTKKPITYLILEPPPANNPYMKADWWIKNQVRIDASPSAVLTFPNGYQIMKFHLDSKQTEVPFDHAIDPGITFR